MTFFIMISHSPYCQHHITPMAPLHFLGQEEFKKVQHDLFGLVMSLAPM